MIVGGARGRGITGRNETARNAQETTQAAPVGGEAFQRRTPNQREGVVTANEPTGAIKRVILARDR
jgi:hypothetical protein